MSRHTVIFLLFSYQFIVGSCHRAIGAKNIPTPRILSRKAPESRPYVPLNSLTTQEDGNRNFFQWVYPGSSLLRQMLEEHNLNVRHDSNSSHNPEYFVRGSNAKESPQGSISSFDGEPNDSLRTSMSQYFDYDREYRKDKEDVELYIKSNNPSHNAEEEGTLFAEDVLLEENPIQNLSKTLEEISSVDPISLVNGNEESNHPDLPSKPEYSEDSADAFNEYVFEHFNLKNQHIKKEKDDITNRFLNYGVKEQFASLENNNGTNPTTESNVIWIFTTMPSRKFSKVSNVNYSITTKLPQTSTEQPTTPSIFEEDYFTKNTIIPFNDVRESENTNNLYDDSDSTVGGFAQPITNTWKPPVEMSTHDFTSKTTLSTPTTDTALLLPNIPFAESAVEDLSNHALHSTLPSFAPSTDLSATTVPPDRFEALEDDAHNQDSEAPSESENSTIATDFEAGIVSSNDEVNIWNYLLKEFHKASQNNPQEFFFTNVTITPHPIDEGEHEASEMLYQIQFDGSKNYSSSDNNQPEETEDSIKDSGKQPNETHFPNLYEFILHRIRSEKVNLKMNQTAENEDKDDNIEEPDVNHNVFTNETKEDGGGYQPIHLGPSNLTVNTSGNTNLNVTNGSNEFESSIINGHLIKDQNELPVQNIYQIFQENNNVNSNTVNNLQNNHQTININNPLSSVPSSLLDLGEIFKSGTKDSLDGDFSSSNSPLSKPEETFFTSSKPSNMTKQNDTRPNTIPGNDPSLVSHADPIESGFPVDGLSISNEEVPIDLSSLLQENLPINNPTTENNVDILKNIDPETLVYEYIQRIIAASKLFNKNDRSNPQVQNIIQDIALELLLSYLMEKNSQPPIQPYENLTTVSENSDEKQNAALLEELMYWSLGENKESPSRDPLGNISNISYDIISKLIEESSTASSEYSLFIPTEKSVIDYLPNVDSAKPETYLPNRGPLIEDLWQIFENTIPYIDSSKIEVSSDGLSNINYDIINDLAYYDYNSPNDELVNDFIGSQSSDFSDEVVTKRPSFFVGTIKNSLTSLTKMISDLVPEGVTYEWCINSRGCSFALAASLALSAIGATGALVYPSVLPFGRRKKQLDSVESRIFTTGLSNSDINEHLKTEFERILNDLALNKRKRMDDDVTVHRTDIVNHLKNEYKKKILKWKKKTNS